MVNTNFAKGRFYRTLEKVITISRVKVKELDEETSRQERSSYKGLTEDALVYGAEEGRGKLRKAAERSKHPLTRRYPNEGTQRE